MTRRLVAGLFLLLAATTPVVAMNELLPPFGFRWGDPPRRVEAVLNGAKAKIVERKQDGSRSVWTVEGLVHPGLQRTLFTFKNDKLMEVELQVRISRLVNRALQRTDGNSPALFRRQIRRRQISVALARYRYRHCPDPGRLSMDGRHDFARAFLLLRGKTAAYFPYHHRRLQSAVANLRISVRRLRRLKLERQKTEDSGMRSRRSLLPLGEGWDEGFTVCRATQARVPAGTVRN